MPGIFGCTHTAHAYTPRLQNNMRELFGLLNLLDPRKFADQVCRCCVLIKGADWEAWGTCATEAAGAHWMGVQPWA